MDNAQLLDEIRYKLAVEPEDSVAISILGPLSNRQKPGGLPSRIHPKSVRNSRYGTENDSRQRGENMTVAFPVEGKLPRRERDMRSRSAEVPSQSEDQNAEKLKRDKSDSRLSDEEVDESFHEGGYQNKGGEQEKWVKVEYEPDEIDALEFDENRDVFEGTREYAKQMVCKRIKRTNDLRQVVKPHLDQEQVDKLFSRKETNLDEIHTHNTSLLSKLMSEEPPKEIESSPFDEFSQFEASNSSDSKKIKVIYTFGEKQHGIPTYLDIKAKSDAKIKDFVGLSLYKYQQNGFKPEAKPSVKLYKLYLADDIYSYDTDLPPLDGNRYLKDIDFPFLALVEEDEDKLQNEPNSYSVQVYFVDGTCIDYDLDDTDITLGWLKTDALMKREEKRKEDGDKRHQAFDYKLLNYRIELYEVPDKALNESASVASAGSRTFVIIRQNSGRGAFDIKLTEKNRNSQYSQQSADFNFDFYSDKPLYVETRAQPIFHNASKSRSQSDEMEPNQASTSNSNSLYGQTASLGQGNVLETFFVERLHRLKPKWTAKLTFRDDCLSLIPVEEDRRRSTQSHPHKSVTISWDLVGGIDYYHTSPSKRSLKIIWLPMPPELFAKQLQCLQYIEYLKSVNISTGKKSSKKGFTSSSSSISLFSMGKKSSSMKLTESHSTMTFKPDDKSEMRPYPEGIEKFQPKDLIHGYERLSWKTLNIETTDDEAWKIGEKLSDIIDQRKSPIRQIFQHSNSGEHRPSSAAETAFRLRNLSYISQNIRQQDEASSSGHKTHRRRFSVNPMPMLNKILSRNE